MSQLKNVIVARSQSGGYHIFFMTKKSYKQQLIINLDFPNDYHINELQGKPAKKIELFTNNNKQVVIAPSTIGKNKYEVISELNDFSKLKPHDDIVKEVTELFTSNGYIYNEIEQYKTHNRQLTAKYIDEVKTKQQSTTNDFLVNTKPLKIDEELINNILECYKDGNFHNFRLALNGNLIKKGWSKKKVENLYKSLQVDHDLNEVKKMVDHDFTQDPSKLSGWKALKENIINNCNPKTRDQVLKYFETYFGYDEVYSKSFKELEKEKRLLASLKGEIAKQYDNDFIAYVVDKMQYLALNEGNNIVKILLACLSVMTKRKRLYYIVIGGADTGKSYLIETTLKHLIPDEYIVYLDDSTIAGFTRQCLEDPYYYDGKIIYLGDLGDQVDYDNAKELLNLLKRLVSEERYNRLLTEKQDKGKSHKPLTIEILGVVGVVYSTVLEDYEDKTKQRESRALTATPAKNNRNDKINFQDAISTEGTIEHYNYHKTIEELKSVKYFMRELVNDYYNDNYEVINPFKEVFKQLTKESKTEIREYINLRELFNSYFFINKEICFKIEKEVVSWDASKKKVIYLIPKLEDVQKFINIVYSSVGLQSIDRNLLLKLKNEFDSISEDQANEIYNKIEEELNEGFNDQKVHIRTFKQMFDFYGVDNKLKRISI